VGIVTLSEGDVTHLHVGLKGTMNALFLKDLAEKTRRTAQPRQGRHVRRPVVLGYDVVKHFATNGEPIRGDRTINEAEAAVVRCIFADYLAGQAPRGIAFDLKKEGAPRPHGAEWGRQRSMATRSAASASSITNCMSAASSGTAPARAGHRAARRPSRDPAVCSEQEKPRRPFGGRGFGALLSQVSLVAGARSQCHYAQLSSMVVISGLTPAAA
jgi:hypothetical protein